MKRIRYNNLGIEIEIKSSEAKFLEIKEFKNCVRVFYDSKRVVTVLKDSKVEFFNFAHIICYRGRVVAFNNTCVEAGSMSRVFAKDRSCVLAYRGSEVRAGGRAKVRALDSSRVIASGRAQVDLEGKSIGYKKSHTSPKINKLDSCVKVFDID